MSATAILLYQNIAAGTRDLGRQIRTFKGVHVEEAHGEPELVERLERHYFDMVLLHLTSCREYAPLIRRITGAASSPPVIVVPAAPSVAEAMVAARAGAFDYLEHPENGETLADRIREAVALRRHERKGATSACRERAGRIAGIIGENRAMQEVYSLIRRVCDTDTTVLVQGESGTGKELIARALHFEGARSDGPFIAVNCGAIPGELLESELFGHEKGAFTHAINTRIGRFELANGGTVFLDEISEMSPMLQVKILRVLQERQFERVGGTRTITSDFRIIAATNRELEEEVRKGAFRQDLYYRLNVIFIKAPPLRERASDIPLLTHHFIEKFNRTKKKAITGISPSALEALNRYSWPGNVRELENVLERMVILAEGAALDVRDLPERIRQPQGGNSHATPVPILQEGSFSLNEVVADFERRLIVQALNETGWVKNRAAKLLAVNRTTLIEKMKRHNLAKPDDIH